MTNELIILNERKIRNNIYTVRGLQVMLDRDLAELYNVETKQINRAVKRNILRFPDNFMFQLTDSEYQSLKSQNVTLKIEPDLRFQTGTSKSNRGGRRYLPYVFTGQGVAMLSGVLKSDAAIKTSLQIINAFVAMRKFIASNAQIFQRLDTVEKRPVEYQGEADKKFNKIFDAIESKSIKPEKGIFFNGQIFDSYSFVSDIVRSAKKTIVLVDNFVDDSVLIHFSKRKNNVSAVIFTKEISKQLSLDLKKYNSQYPPIVIKEFKNSHDRFLIIDNKEVYHLGASLKDLGRKWFAFSKFDQEAFKLLEKLNNEKNCKDKR